MKQEDKDLLVKDLCSRLPYGVKVQTTYINQKTKEKNDIGIDTLSTVEISMLIEGYEEHKPYLFPLSSVTEEQVNELFSIFELDETLEDDYIKVNEVTGITFLLRNGFDVEEHLEKLMDWLNKYHFDYRGLIPKGLAIDATGLSIYE